MISKITYTDFVLKNVSFWKLVQTDCSSDSVAERKLNPLKLGVQ